MRIYIAGAVTGLPRDVTEKKFERVAQLLKSRSHSVVNPLSEISDPECSSKSAMKQLIPLLLDCDAIFLLSDWKFSEGAKIEAILARYAGMKVLREEDLNVIN